MEYVVPLLILLVVVIVVVVAARLLGRRNRFPQEPAHDDITESGPSAPAGTPAAKSAQAKSPQEKPQGAKGAGRGREISRESAVEASARLTPESHQRVYSLIAQHQVLNAVQAYRKATRMGLGDSAAAVAALAQFPQPSPEGAIPAVRDAPLTVEDIMQAAPEAGNAVSEVQPKPAATPNTYRYRAIVSRGEEVREVASTRLNEDIFRHIRDLAQSGNYDGAARLLRDHADIGETDAQEFVSMIGPED